jgi:hypothetical protein
MEMISVAKARKIMGKTNSEFSDKEMEDIIQFLYKMARIDVDLFNEEREKAEMQHKSDLLP